MGLYNVQSSGMTAEEIPLANELELAHSNLYALERKALHGP